MSDTNLIQRTQVINNNMIRNGELSLFPVMEIFGVRRQGLNFWSEALLFFSLEIRVILPALLISQGD
jgi:hypothetical protein